MFRRGVGPTHPTLLAKEPVLPRSVSSSQGRFVDPVAYPQGSGAFRDGLTEFGLSVAVRVKACWTFIMTTKWVPLRRLSFGDGYTEFCGSVRAGESFAFGSVAIFTTRKSTAHW